MDLINHILLFLFSLGVVWFFAGVLIDSVDRVAKRFNKTGFTVAFFVLGFLTSISEISVAVNSSIENQPQISAGNLIGASFVIMLLIVPFLAVAAKGISLKKLISDQNLIFALGVIALPAFFVLDGAVTRLEGVFILLLYAALVVSIHKKESILPTLESVDESLLHKKHPALKDLFKILIGAGVIFLAGHILVKEGVYFSAILNVPSSIVGLLILGIGTNMPELVIAIRSIYKKHTDIAFGDYLGSAVANTPVFAVLVLEHGTFFVEPTEFVPTFFLMLGGLILFYFFAKSDRKLSRTEGWILLYVYFAFLVVQTANLVNLSNKI